MLLRRIVSCVFGSVRLSYKYHKSIRKEVGAAGPAGLRGPHLCIRLIDPRLPACSTCVDEKAARTDGGTSGRTDTRRSGSPKSTAEIKYQELSPGWLADWSATHDHIDRLRVLREAPVPLWPHLLFFSCIFIVDFSIVSEIKLLSCEKKKTTKLDFPYFFRVNVRSPMT